MKYEEHQMIVAEVATILEKKMASRISPAQSIREVYEMYKGSVNEIEQYRAHPFVMADALYLALEGGNKVFFTGYIDELLFANNMSDEEFNTRVKYESTES